jgi:hypothetical protein
MTFEQVFGSSMGKLTIERCGSGWIVCEDGRRVGGTVRYAFTSQAAAQHYIDAELADEAEIMARGDVGLSARARFIRGTNPKLWAKFERIEAKFADDNDARQAAHAAAGTLMVGIEMVVASLEAQGKLERCSERDGKSVYRTVGPTS